MLGGSGALRPWASNVAILEEHVVGSEEEHVVGSERKTVRALESERSTDPLRDVVEQARGIPDPDWRERIAFAKKVRRDTLEARENRASASGIIVRSTP